MINNKAINMFKCALNPIEFHRVSICDTAKEMWDMLEAIHEGTSQVKESKINTLIHIYELFKMKLEESIQDMYTRLNDIVTNLKALGKVYPNQEVVRKVLRSLPKSWEAKKTTIEESKGLKTLKLDDLIGNLMTYEIDVQVDGKVEVVEKKKNVALKTSNQKEESEDDACDGEDISALISKEVRRFMKKNFKSKLAKRVEKESSKNNVKCYECNKMGHYRNECPQLKKVEKKDKKNKKNKKKKAFATTWSDDETSSMESESSLENGVANLCFMAQKDSNNDEEVNSNFSSSINESSFEYSYDDLCKVLDCSMNDIKKLGNENLALTKTISLLRNEIESLSKQNEVCLVSKMKNKWYLDSRCSRHMTGDPSQFSSLMPLDGGTVTFGDNGKGIVKGIGKIGNKSISFHDVWYVDGLKHNLLSISQLCDHMLSVVFSKSHCKIIDSRNDKVLFVGKRL
ncbi:hypothetical protein SLEP1_g50379 [Rubroshorea leprosula]|uniref:CCHC-type domain-containing protein n=1 Tax=Rubroshorea leprosula TaxID=152421 RepID=A0AAV5M262_9ROSI|nr:hypothetical protein SLEP1_g50379 [Rubroshorea leprosula]